MKNAQLLTCAETLQLLKQSPYSKHLDPSVNDKNMLRTVAATQANIGYLSLYQGVCANGEQMAHRLVEQFPSLTQFDVMQIINIAPTTVVHLYSVIDRCSERYTEDDLNTMLALISDAFGNDGNALVGDPLVNNENSLRGDA
ncbi:RNA polymerase Rpb4 [Gregarina niphandrodes]|uniref:DNA-directed RNA polymerase III subunit RPC9 n=1 Tax=Gregarina niphandrodes TaxID=110365 RepID=A0A023B757_GRENI|nr:RNA polymerase Rpb4 [Gregarina niphandrodes]EZG67001.1 RNA polymerase Rpb4 [Gregarina niphandrodes]|eukprot:XP_011130388.1 RNA polymerase Rpb4 [Gregarina niphandrodes]